MIKKDKRECNIQKLRNNPNAKTLYRNLKSHKRKDQIAEVTPDLKTLNEFFTTIGSKLADAVPPSNKEYFVPKFEKTMVLNYTNQHEISKILAKMKNKKSSGHDGISNEILKCCSPVIENYLTNCFNNCIEKQFFPNSLKVAKVIPLYKKGNANDPGNYRPISLLSSLSKVFEKLLYHRWLVFSIRRVYSLQNNMVLDQENPVHKPLLKLLIVCVENWTKNLPVKYVSLIYKKHLTR